MPDPFPDPFHVEAAFHALAIRAVIRMIKHRARGYAQHPMALETITPGLAAAAPDTLEAVARQLIERERVTPRRWFGFGGEVPLLNAKALLLLARVRRRAAAGRSRRALLKPQGSLLEPPSQGL